jgi:hypothetical protein
MTNHIDFDAVVIYGEPIDIFVAGSRDTDRPKLLGQLVKGDDGTYEFEIMRFGNPRLTAGQMDELVAVIATINACALKIIEQGHKL